MDWSTAEAGIEHYLASQDHGNSPRIKFFGGEPLLNAALIRRVIETGRTRWQERGMRFEISTNGTFLDDGLLRYFAARPEVEITVSQWQPWAAKLPGAWFTLVMEPGGRAKEFTAKLGRVCRSGFRGFNFLPAYYEYWDREDLDGLRLSLAAAQAFILGLWKRGIKVRVKNFDLWSPVPLYNDALTLDVDGTFYASNLVQCNGTEKFHESLRLGDIKQPLGFLSRVKRPGGDELAGILQAWAGSDLWNSTLNVDAILTEFVHSLRMRRSLN